MLYFVTIANIEYNWHVGEKNPINRKSIAMINEVQADGDELDYIYTHIPNLPAFPERKSVRWFGDDAKFIAANL